MPRTIHSKGIRKKPEGSGRARNTPNKPKGSKEYLALVQVISRLMEMKRDGNLQRVSFEDELSNLNITINFNFGTDEERERSEINGLARPAP